jgi:alpha-beta hydrolase superfamily lysophospholipase
LSIGEGLRPHPAQDYAAACAAFEVLAGRDGPEISLAGRSRFFSHGKRTARAVVLLHGLTNAPAQWSTFAEQLHADGITVLTPRFPGHGYVDRTTHAIARVSADDLLAVASEAVDIACGAGDIVTLAGLSVGAAMAAWLAFARRDIAQILAIVPFFGIARFGERANRAIANVLGTLPNAFVPWDPGGDGSQIPPYGYASFPTHVLAACLRIGLDTLALARTAAPHGRLDVLLNAREPACNNALSSDLVARIVRLRPAAARAETWDDLPAIHDIIDPTNPKARTDLVYPRLATRIWDFTET